MNIKLIPTIVLLFSSIQIIFAQVAIAPIEYIKNDGQWDAPFAYKGTTPRGDFFLSKTGFTYLLGHKDNGALAHNKHHGRIAGPVTLNYHAYRMNFVNPNESVQITDAKRQQHYYNYFLGNDQSRWKSNIHPALNVDYKNLYNNIDAHIYSENGNLKYDFIVHAGANINDLAFEYEGATSIKLRKKSIEIYTSVGDNIELPPYAYQIIDGEKIEVTCDYVLNGTKMRYALGKNYNPKFDLIIDPIVVFCTFTGSTADNWGYTATYDSLGNFYAGGIVGFPTGTSFVGTYPVTTGAFQATFGGGGAGGMGNLFRYDASLSKFNSIGTTLLYATYLGGIDNDQPQSLVVDHAGNCVIAGRTYSSNFPTTTGCYDASFNGNGDLFVTKLNWNGTALNGSTFVGGSGDDGVNLYADELVIGDLKHNYSDDARSEVIVDSLNNVYVAAATSSSNFPNANANQTTIGGLQDGVVFKLNSNCTALPWSTFIGGSNNDAAYVLSFNKKNNNELFVAGGTMSSNFTTTVGTIHPTFQGGGIDGWVRKYNNTTNALLASTFIGTAGYDQVYGVQTDDSNNVFIMGQTQGAYPVLGTVYSNPGSSQFATKINNTLTANLISTVFGKGSTSTTDIAPNAFLVDQCGNIYISGWGGPIIPNNPGNTNGLPVTANALKSNTDGSDFYFIVFDQNFSSLLYASFFGQNGGQGEHVDGGTSRFDPQGVIYQAICARCSDTTTSPSIIFPTTPGVYAPNNLSSNCNLASVKIDFQIIGANAVAIANPSTTGCAPFIVNFNNNSTNATNYLWDFGDGTPTVVSVSPSHTYNLGGTYNVKLVAYNPNGCLAPSDTAFLTIIVRNDSIKNNFTITKIDSCNPFNIQANNLSIKTPAGFGANATFTWSWGDGNNSTGQNPGVHNYAVAGSYVITLTITDTTACNSPQVSTKVVSFINNVISTTFTMPDTVCPPFTHTFTNTTIGNVTYAWNFGNGNFSTTSTPTQAYNLPGTYTISLIVSDPASCNKKDSAKQILHVQPTIQTSFTTLKIDTCLPFKLGITNTSVLNNLYPNATSWTKILWDFGDGTTSTLANPTSHTYTQPGTYTVTLTVTDTTACNSPQLFTQVVTFVNNNISTDFIMPDTGCIPFVWTFNNNTINASNYAWNFGTVGANSTNTTPTYTFTAIGTYTITLLVQNPNTCNKLDTASQVITIVPNPTANFYYLPNPPLPNKPVNFNNQSTGAISYFWDFGDGASSTLENPTHFYNKSANLNVCLTAYNEYGCPDTACRQIRPEVTNIVDVPTAFSPNGDGINDFVQVRGYGVKSMVFKIYNRFGELVFSTTNINEKWDGKFKGKLQEMEAFAYLLNVTFTDESITSKKGNITLIY